jgi:hypothetical protein
MSSSNEDIKTRQEQLKAYTDAIAERDRLIEGHQAKIRELQAEQAICDQRVLEIMRCWMEQRLDPATDPVTQQHNIDVARRGPSWGLPGAQ